MSTDYSFEDSLNYPFRPDDAVKTILIGGFLPLLAGIISFVASILSIIFIGFLLYPLVIIPGLFVRGYEVSVFRSVFAGLEEPPEFEDWGELGIDGLKAFGIDVVLTLPALVVGLVGFVFVFLFGAAAGTGGDSGAAAGLLSSGLFLALLLFVLVYTLLVVYVRPAAIANMVLEGEFTAAFSPSALRRLSLNGTYLVGWLVGTGIIVAGALLGSFLTFILIGFAIIFVARVMGTHAFAMAIRDADGFETDPEYAPDYRREEARELAEERQSDVAGAGRSAGAGAAGAGATGANAGHGGDGTADDTTSTDTAESSDGAEGADPDGSDDDWNEDDDDQYW